MKKTLLYFFTLTLSTWGISQSVSPEVIASSGDHFTGTNVQLSWTIGETMIETFAIPSDQITQGFHQTNLTITSVEGFDKTLQVSIYPNPTQDILTIEWNEITEPLTFTMHDLGGKLLFSRNSSIQNLLETLDLSAYPAGSYYLHLSNADNKIIKTFKILKIK